MGYGLYGAFYGSLLSQAGGKWFDFEGLVRALYLSVLRPGDTAVDVGAHKGDHTYQMAQAVAPNGRVVAIEAAPEMLEILAANGARFYSHLGGIVDIRGIGVSHSHGRTAFYYSKETPGLSGLRERPAVGPAAMYPVNLAPLDFICASVPRPVRFLKIDIEGGEYDALRGAARIMAEDQPVIVFEHEANSPEHFSYAMSDLLAVFHGARYRLFDFFGHSYDSLEAWESTMIGNFLAVPRAREPGPLFAAVQDSLNAIGVHYTIGSA